MSQWADREELVPLTATEVYVYPQDQWDPERRAVVQKLFWYRYDWTPDADIGYLPAEFKPREEPNWQIDKAQTFEHGDGYAHMAWVQNLPSDEIDGVPDYEGLYEAFGTIDIISSVLAKGAALNLDPTLVLKVDPDIVQRKMVRKGSDNALTVGPTGDAKYMELTGTSLTAGADLLEKKRRHALEVAQCVLPDPEEIAASGMSSVAMKVVYAPMLAKGDQLREQYGTCGTHILGQMIGSARNLAKTTVQVPGEDPNAEPEEAQYVLSLPPKVRSEPVIDEATGQPTGEEHSVIEDHDPGEATQLEPEWGPWFPPTPDDQLKTAQTLTAGLGGAGTFMSQQSAVEVMAAQMAMAATDEQGVGRTSSSARASSAGTSRWRPRLYHGYGQDELPDGAQPRQPDQQDSTTPTPRPSRRRNALCGSPPPRAHRALQEPRAAAPSRSPSSARRTSPSSSP